MNNRSGINSKVIISIKKWKENRQLSLKEKQVNNFLKVLSFQQLINESTDIVKKLKSEPLNPELAFKSKLILKEFNKRLNDQSPELANSLQNIRNNVEKKIEEFTSKI